MNKKMMRKIYNYFHQIQATGSSTLPPLQQLEDFDDDMDDKEDISNTDEDDYHLFFYDLL